MTSAANWAEEYVQKTCDDILRQLSHGKARWLGLLELTKHSSLNPKPIFLNWRSRLKSWTSRWVIFARFLRLWCRISDKIPMGIKCPCACTQHHVDPAYTVNLPRKDLLQLAHSFENQNSWGKMRALTRWCDRQWWRKILPQPFLQLG